jgi:hypothetical protein
VRVVSAASLCVLNCCMARVLASKDAFAPIQSASQCTMTWSHHGVPRFAPPTGVCHTRPTTLPCTPSTSGSCELPSPSRLRGVSHLSAVFSSTDN